ncbi:MAG: dihydroorotase family protein [Rhodospirillales bacterium]|nr:dihydroorotase family protein [Rhodospirillales bacterium]
MAGFDLVVKGKLVLPDRVIDDGYLAITDGRIAKIGTGTPPQAKETVDASGKFVLPGAIDGQVHAGSQKPPEGILRSTRSAAAGGVTTIIDMPYDDAGPIVDAESFRAKVAVVDKEAMVDVGLYATIRKENGVAAIPGLVEAGACAFKFSTYESHPVRFPRIKPIDMLAAFEALAPTGIGGGVHNENQEMVDFLIQKLQAEGKIGPEAHGMSRPPIAEALAMAEIYELGAAANSRVHVVHCSIPRGIEITESYKRQGVKATVEVCVHYLTLDEDDMIRVGAFGKINPPIRPRHMVEAMWGHVAAGHIDFVSTDHSPWPVEVKSNPNIFKNASGAPGLETLIPALFTGCEQHGLPITTVAKLISEGPAKYFLLYPKKGVLREGSDADFAIVEPGRFKFDARNTVTIVDWSPFDGKEFTCRVAATYLRGRKVWDGKAVLSEPGYGNFLRPLRGADAA